MSTAAATWNDIYQSNRSQRWWPNEDVVRFVMRRLDGEVGHPHPRVLEVGCGNGANTWGLIDLRCEVEAVDVSDSAVNMAARYISDRRPNTMALTLHVGTVEQCRFEADSFDAVIDCRVSQHMPWSEHREAYEEYLRVLKPGGWLFLFHLTEDTTDARWNDGLRTEGENYTWDDIELGVYPHNGVVCMPPWWRLSGATVAAGFATKHIERLSRESIHEGGAHTVAAHVAIDAQKPG